MTIKFGSWNIWAFGDKNYEEMADLIREHDIDILGLQEVVTFSEEGITKNMAEQIAEELGYHCVFYPAIDFSKDDHDPDRKHTMGNAVISRFPIKESTVHSLNPEKIEYDGSPEKEPRILIKAEIATDEGEVSFLTAHLQYAHKFKTTEISKTQVQNINSVIENLEGHTVLSGDFNSPLESPEMDILAENLEVVEDDSPTWTVHPFDYRGWEVNDLDYRVDNILVSPDLTVKDSRTIKSELSDHLPVVANIEI